MSRPVVLQVDFLAVVKDRAVLGPDNNQMVHEDLYEWLQERLNNNVWSNVCQNVERHIRDNVHLNQTSG